MSSKDNTKIVVVNRDCISGNYVPSFHEEMLNECNNYIKSLLDEYNS